MPPTDPTPELFRPIVISSPAGLTAEILRYGARLAALRVPTRHGIRSLVLGYPRPDDFARDMNFLGCTIGRLSGRVANSAFRIASRIHRLPANDPPHHLHGGPAGFHARAWEVLDVDHGARPCVVLGLHSPDGDCGYPGNLQATATFRLDGLELSVELAATTDQTTPVSLTLHPYFNLSGSPDRPIHEHELLIHADEFLELGDGLIPTGRRLPVAGGPFDFRVRGHIGARLAATHPQLTAARGFDHTYLLRPGRPFDAELTHAGTGISMRVASNQSGLQLYTGQGLAPLPQSSWKRLGGLCLEPQHLPNAVNEPRFPPPWLRPGERYGNVIRYAFRAAD